MKKAFTLIELLVVIAIIAILAVIVILNLSSARPKARDARRKNDLVTIQTAVEMYMDTNTSPPGVVGTTYGSDQANWSTLLTAINTGSEGNIINSLPKDPNNTSPYIYRYQRNAGEYELNCTFEKDTNAMLNTNDGGNRDNWYEIGTKLTIMAN